MKKISVVFTKSWQSYNPGDRAGFPADKNGKIRPIEEGVARLANGSVQSTLTVRESGAKSGAKSVDLVDELSGLSWQALKSRAHQIAKDHDESLSSLEDQSTETLIDYILSHKE